jgi:hypothetical protein
MTEKDALDYKGRHSGFVRNPSCTFARNQLKELAGAASFVFLKVFPFSCIISDETVNRLAGVLLRGHESKSQGTF